MSFSPITIKRINGEIKQFIKTNENNNISIYPNPDNILEIFFKIKGLDDSPFKSGEYICKLVHKPEYPLKAPDYYVLTPNGRFHTNRKICLTNSAYHQSDWAPAAWNLLTLLNGFHNIWHSEISEDKVGIGHIKSSKETIKKLAIKSSEFNKGININNNFI